MRSVGRKASLRRRVWTRVAGGFSIVLVVGAPLVLLALVGVGLLDGERALTIGVWAVAFAVVVPLLIAGILWVTLVPRVLAARRAMEEWAAGLGLAKGGSALYTPTEGDEGEVFRAWTPADSSVAPLGIRGRHVANDLFGGVVDGVEVTLGEVGIQDVDRQGKGVPRFLRFHLVALSGLGPLPVMWLEPQGAVNTLAVTLGAQDVDVESAEFNQRWRVRSTDPRAAHEVLTPAVIARVLQPDAHGLVVGISPGMLVVAFDQDMVDLPAMQRAYAVLRDLRSGLPGYLRQP